MDLLALLDEVAVLEIADVIWSDWGRDGCQQRRREKEQSGTCRTNFSDGETVVGRIGKHRSGTGGALAPKP